ncbi:MAG: hypothetical protein HYZ49_05850 [Chloroflexi bacterium]|nr:hypothetical protein [Chloroflexota bacterium]
MLGLLLHLFIAGLTALGSIVAGRGTSYRTRHVLAHLPGIWGVVGAYLLLSWVELAPWEFLNSGLLDGLMGGLFDVFPILSFIINSRWIAWLGPVFNTLSLLANLNGLLAVMFELNLDFAQRFMLILPGLVALASLVASITAAFLPVAWRSRLGFAQTISAGMALLGLIFNLNALDAWGSRGRLATGLVALLTNAQVGIGPYFAMLGLIGLMVSGLWQASHSSSESSDGSAGFSSDLFE